MQDLDELRRRIYQKYRKTTAANTFKGAAWPLEAQVEQYHRRWSRFLPENRHSRILDIGCGGGEFLIFLSQSGYIAAEGIDISPEQVRLAQQRGAQRVQIADAIAYLADRPHQYSVINAANILEHLTRSELFELLDAIVNALEPNGRLFGVVPNAKSLLGARVRYADISHELSFTPESLYQIFAIVGLKPIALMEHGPLVHGVVSALRWATWQIIRALMWTILVAEGADYKNRIYTQNMMFIAEKLEEANNDENG